MELKIFRDTLPQAGTSCTVKAELPLETEILISDYLPPVFKLVKCFAKPVVLQKQLQPGRLTLEGYLRCTVFYQGEDGAGLCQTEQKLPFTKQLEVPEFSFTSWMAMVEGQTEYLNCRAVNPHRIEVRGAYGLVVTIHTQDKQELITALADGGIEQKLQMHVRAGAGWLCPCGGRTGSQRPTDSQRDDAFARMAALPAAIRSGCLFYAV